jgi:hypothetical protein
VAKFRRRASGLVDAVQFNGHAPLPPGVEYARNPGREPHFYVVTRRGECMSVRPGDWVLTGEDGRRWVVEEDQFAPYYETAEGG